MKTHLKRFENFNRWLNSLNRKKNKNQIGIAINTEDCQLKFLNLEG